ncbi:hypothetical protein I302_107992 [Kwoniella bestiolae CBS 10118]|uniref:Peroxin-14 n=1 Tax=Kwoniella bestiolae CBS 10118 TaxID=1296100 RepID=A0A1B9FWZ6_9TREE|nr:hypothetical protein I302_07643 [Kwoniella bestiolae CBS 10118]OCF23289.1 hypothetical protein I302_07643 [Kwoniella bestiolae CBS 10118]
MSDDSDNRNAASSSRKQNDPTNNPLFGAPPASATSTDIPPQPLLNEAGPSNPIDIDTTYNPLYGASPPRDDTPWHTSSEQYRPTPRELRLYHRPRSAHIEPSKTIQFMRQLTFILSLIFGLSSAIAGVWSVFILPLLHSSFSARKALVSQQSERVRKLLEGVRRLRALGLYPKRNLEAPAQTEGDDDEKQVLKKEEASLKEISSSIDSLLSQNIPSHPPSQSSDGTVELIPTTPLTALSSKLKVLSSSMDATSTTRTSVISTLEGYTSSIHHQLFLARSSTGGMSSYGVNMNSLSNHLNGNTGKQTGMGLGLGEEWDNTRKEIRAIKGMLLNRRQFSGTK